MVPIVNASVAALVRHRRGHRLRLEQFSWQFMGVAGGWMLTVFARRRQAALARDHDRDLRARLQGAELAGLHDVVMANEGAIDVLQRATALIDLGGVKARRRDFAGAFKADVAAAVRSSATYLRDALMIWQTRHNLQPELSRAVHIDLDPADGTILLDAAQVARLHAALDALAPAGACSGRARRPRRVGAARTATGILPSTARSSRSRATLRSASWTFDAIPTAFLMNIGWLLQPTGQPSRGRALVRDRGCPSRWAWARRSGRPGAPTATASFRRAGRWPSRSRARSCTRSPRAARCATRTRTDAVSRFPVDTRRSTGYELVRSIVAPQLDPDERRLAAAGTA